MRPVLPHPSALPDCATLRTDKALAKAGLRGKGEFGLGEQVRNITGGVGNVGPELPREVPRDVSAAFSVFSPVTVARFWSKVEVTPSDKDCWLWKGAKQGNGYGNFRAREYGRATLAAHRVAYAIFNGDMPPDHLLVRHDCDTPLCQNPKHLRLGTAADNSRDMRERGRSFMCGRVMVGDANPAAKLNAEKVEQIRELIARGKNNTFIAARFGVTHAAISNIRRGKSWAAGIEVREVTP